MTPREEKASPSQPSEAITLRNVIESDLEIFFQHQSDPLANRMADFEGRDRPSFFEHWATNVLGDDTVSKKTIIVRQEVEDASAIGEVAGNIVGFSHDGRRMVGYWLGAAFWGRGIATRALSAFVDQETTRPLFAYVARGNQGSIRVLEKCGFVRAEVETAEELLFVLGG